MMLSIFSIREYLSLEISHRMLPGRLDDQYLVSFPRSGNTWVRTMLGYLINPEANGNPDFTRSRIPGISIRKIKTINAQESPRLIKSHSWYRPSIPRAIYIVRDGRDVLVSLYHYYITREHKDLSFEKFFQGYLNRKFGQLWHENVESWLTRGRDQLKENLLIISFEELKADPQQTLALTARFLDLPADESQITKAIDIANISRMRNIEVQRRGPIINENASFYRGGKTGEWKDYFSPEIETAYLDLAAKALSIAGYI